MTHKKQHCLHCAIQKAIGEFLAAEKADPADPENQRAVLASLANVVSDRIVVVHQAVRLIAYAEFSHIVASYVAIDLEAEIEPSEGEHVH